MHTLLSARRRSRRAFTLVELIVVIVIIGLLAAVGAFAYNGVVSSSRQHAARMMAVHFAQDAVGVAASRQVPISTMLTTDPTALANLTTDTNGTAAKTPQSTKSLVAATRSRVAGLASLVAGRAPGAANTSALVAASPLADGTTTATVAGNKITIEWGHRRSGRRGRRGCDVWGLLHPGAVPGHCDQPLHVGLDGEDRALQGRRRSPAGR